MSRFLRLVSPHARLKRQSVPQLLFCFPQKVFSKAKETISPLLKNDGWVCLLRSLIPSWKIWFLKQSSWVLIISYQSSVLGLGLSYLFVHYINELCWYWHFDTIWLFAFFNLLLLSYCAAYLLLVLISVEC